MSVVTDLPETLAPAPMPQQVRSRHRRGAGRWVVLTVVVLGAWSC